MALYTVHLVHIQTRDISEYSVTAMSDVNAYLKAFLLAGIDADEIDDYDKRAIHIMNLSDAGGE